MLRAISLSEGSQIWYSRSFASQELLTQDATTPCFSVIPNAPYLLNSKHKYVCFPMAMTCTMWDCIHTSGNNVTHRKKIIQHPMKPYTDRRFLLLSFRPVIHFPPACDGAKWINVEIGSHTPGDRFFFPPQFSFTRDVFLNYSRPSKTNTLFLVFLRIIHLPDQWGSHSSRKCPSLKFLRLKGQTGEIGIILFKNLSACTWPSRLSHQVEYPMIFIRLRVDRTIKT
jgi:hypothetical protein